ACCRPCGPCVTALPLPIWVVWRLPRHAVAARWSCRPSCSVLLSFSEDARFSELLVCFTSPLFEQGLLNAVGTKTFFCSLVALLVADCDVSFWFEPVWCWSTFRPPLPAPSLPLVSPDLSLPSPDLSLPWHGLPLPP